MAKSESGVAKNLLGRLQRLACLAITGAIRPTPTAAIGLQPLDIYIESVAMSSCYRINGTGSWSIRGVHTNHTRIQDIMGAEIPITSMCGYIMVPYFSFNRHYQVHIPTRQHWMDNEAPVIPGEAIAVYTDGSSEPRGTGAGIYFDGLTEDMSIPLGKYATVFQAETYAIKQCALVLKTLGLTDEPIFICSDSQDAIRALHEPRITSKLVRECMEALNELAVYHPPSGLFDLGPRTYWDTGQ